MIIGVAGKKGSGKSTVAEHIGMRYGFTGYAFANPMRWALKEIFGWSDAIFSEENKEIVDPIWGISPRQALQHIGTDWAQIALCEAFPSFKAQTGRRLWVKRFFECEYNPAYNWVISDVRFNHEVDAIREHGGVIIKVISNRTANTDPHPSENQSFSSEYMIANNGTMHELHAQVDSIMLQLYDGRPPRV